MRRRWNVWFDTYRCDLGGLGRFRAHGFRGLTGFGHTPRVCDTRLGDLWFLGHSRLLGRDRLLFRSHLGLFGRFCLGFGFFLDFCDLDLGHGFWLGLCHLDLGGLGLGLARFLHAIAFRRLRFGARRRFTRGLSFDFDLDHFFP